MFYKRINILKFLINISSILRKCTYYT